MKLQNWTRPFAELTFPPSATHFVLKITTFRAPAIYSNFTEYCACQEKWHSKITKYCACHATWLSWLMSVTHDTSFTMRGATDLILQHHQMLRLPRKMTRIIYPRDIWNVIYNARRNRHHPPTSPNTAPATQNDSHDWSSSHIKTSFTMRGATDLILQHHQMLRLPRKMTRIIYPRDIWNAIYNARRNRHHPPTSPNTAPATQNDSHDWSSSHIKRHLQCAELQISSSNITKRCACQKNDAHYWLSSHMKRHLQCAEQQASPSNLTKYCACHAKLHSKIKEKFAENNWSVISNARPIRPWSEHDPTMIRPWNCKTEPVRSHSLLFPPRQHILYWKLQHFALRLSTQISPNTAPATKSDAPRSPNTAPATKSDTPRSPNTAPATKSSTPRSPNAAPAMKSDTELLLDCTLTCYLTWIVALLTCYLTELSEQLLHCRYLTELLLDWAVTSLLLLYWAVTLLSCYFTELLLSWAVTLLSCYFTELLLDWAVTLLSCYCTELLLYWAATFLSCYFTELFLDWADSLVSCCCTELLLYWAATWLNCYLTELLLYWTVTLLSCYFTELLLYWAVSLLSC